MITFNGPRTTLQDDGSRTYSLAEKRFLIGVVIHEIGHFYFPMLVNSDERQWTWMDEGLNSFLDGVAGREWDPDIPWGVEPRDVVDYMKSEDQVPIMTQSDSVLNLGPNAYTKPAVALNILRETILGRELFDFAFASTPDAGSINDRRRQISSAPSRKPAASIWTGSGAAGSTPLTTSISPSTGFPNCGWTREIRTSTSNAESRRKPTSRCRSRSNAIAPKASCGSSATLMSAIFTTTTTALR